MGESYLVPAGYGEAEYIEKKSRFIARVWRTDTEEEALARLNETREAFRDATHNVYAYMIRENNLTRYSDDGEPSGTSGLPTLSVFSAAGIQNVCCVVTRYFGGTLLGTGGLVRAYTKAAQAALEKAGVSKMALWSIFSIECDYNFYDIVKRSLAGFEAAVRGTTFGVRVEMTVLVPAESAEYFERSVADSSAGRAHCKYISDEYLAVRTDAEKGEADASDKP